MKLPTHITITLASVLLLSVLCACEPESALCENNNYDYVLPPESVDIIEHPHNLQATPGSNVTFSCSIGPQTLRLNGSIYKSSLSWRFNGSSVNRLTSTTNMIVSESGDGSSTLHVFNVTETDIGYYECVVGDGKYYGRNQFAMTTVSKRAWLEVTGTITPTPNSLQPPVLGMANKDVLGLPGFVETFQQKCNVSGPNQSLYWYKDGMDITQYYNTATGVLTYNESDVYGVYQCFIENSAGSDYVNFRVIQDKFSNPPANFSCRAVDHPMDRLIPALVLSWDEPSLVVGAVPNKYIVKIQNKCFRVDSRYFEYNLMEDDHIKCEVYLDNTPNSVMDGGIASQNIYTLQDRRYNQDSVIPLTVSCPASLSSTGEGVIDVTLRTPEIPDYTACLTAINLKGVCLHGDRSLSEEEFTLSADLYSDDYTPDPYEVLGDCSGSISSYPLSVANQPPGAVCLFGGSYNFDQDSLVLPTAPCAVPSLETQNDVWLTVSCSESLANVSWSSSLQSDLNVTVTGKCVNEDFNITHLSPQQLMAGELLTFDGLTAHSVCTFYGNYSNNATISILEPVQCVAGVLPDPPNPPVTTEIFITPTEPWRLPVYASVIVSLVCIVVFTVAMVIVGICAMSGYQRRQRAKEKENLHFLARVVEQQLDNPEYPPVNPNEMPMFHCVSTTSINTVIDYFYKDDCPTAVSESHPSLTSSVVTLEKDPQLIMERFLNTSEVHKDTDEIDESIHVGGVPDTDILRLLAESTVNYMNSTAGSSGYGSSSTQTVEDKEYFKQRVNDLSEDQTESPDEFSQTLSETVVEEPHCVTEYFEPDEEGYVHMVPYQTHSHD